MPDGSKAATVKCNIDNSKCYAQASEICGGGKYRVLDSESHAGGLVADWIPGPVTWYTSRTNTSTAHSSHPRDSRYTFGNSSNTTTMSRSEVAVCSPRITDPARKEIAADGLSSGE